jgi:hypothetical protein
MRRTTSLNVISSGARARCPVGGVGGAAVTEMEPSLYAGASGSVGSAEVETIGLFMGRLSVSCVRILR